MTDNIPVTGGNRSNGLDAWGNPRKKPRTYPKHRTTAEDPPEAAERTILTPDELRLLRQREAEKALKRNNRTPVADPEGPDPVPIELLPHPQAPILASSDGREVFQQVLTLAQSGTFSTQNAEIREVLRQAGFVSLWFFLRVVAAYNGPYERLTNHLHVDMANHYQRFMYPGSWSAFFLFRSGFKSTLITYGANGWELLRNPDLTIAMGSAISDRAYDFLHETQRIFDSNEFFQWLYPEYVPPSGRQRSWNDKEMTLPNRTRRKVAPSIQILSVGASSQGVHVELLKLDDIVGDAQLSSERTANADMRRITNWFKSNKRTLVDKPETSRIVVVGTRYGVDDPYEQIMESIAGQYGGGWEDIPREPTDDGEWNVYYRQAVESGHEVFPEALSRKTLARIRDEDPWNYLTQYINNPYTVETAELSAFEPGTSAVDYDPTSGWVLSYFNGTGWTTHYLSDCDVVVATDPAATERNVATVKSSRSATVVIATAPDRTHHIIDIRADHVPISTVFDWMFATAEKWRPRVESLEQNGPFKVLRSMIVDEQHRRGRWLPLVPAKGVGDKDARIRSELEPRLRDGRLYLTEATRDTFLGELVAFPGGHKKDVLDATAQGLMLAIVPQSPEEREEEEEEYEMAVAHRSKYTGY